MLPFHIPRTAPLLEGVLVRRYKRFLADVELPGEGQVTAHCVNPGAMEGLTRPGSRVWLSRASNPKRKLKFTWQLAEVDGVLVGAETTEPNRIVRQLLEARALPWLNAWDEMKPEQRYGENSRIDFWLRRGRREIFLEVKNCHLVYPDGRAYFPDSVSQRAAGHLRELADLRTTRKRGEVLFVCQYPGAQALRPSDVHDPVFAATAREVKSSGVRFSAIEVRHTPAEMIVTRRLPVDFKPYRTERIERWRKTRVERKNLPLAGC
ncbi:MAG: DNA/RNA nuclease SfsA [Acidobacteriota bacterium]